MISAHLLKTAALVISKHLIYHFKLTLRSGKIHSDWKEATKSLPFTKEETEQTKQLYTYLINICCNKNSGTRCT